MPHSLLFLLLISFYKLPNCPSYQIIWNYFHLGLFYFILLGLLFNFIFQSPLSTSIVVGLITDLIKGFTSIDGTNNIRMFQRNRIYRETKFFFVKLYQIITSLSSNVCKFFYFPFLLFLLFYSVTQISIHHCGNFSSMIGNFLVVTELVLPTFLVHWKVK